MAHLLALDISTSITGITILDIDTGKTEHIAAWDFRNKNKFSDTYISLENVEGKLKYIKSQFDIKEIYIEQSLLVFKPGQSSAKTLAMLTQFNGNISWICYKVFNIKPEKIAATSARKLCGIRVPRGQAAKKVVMQHLIDNDSNFAKTVEYTSHGNPKPAYYDMADSLIIARAGLIILEAND